MIRATAIRRRATALRRLAVVCGIWLLATGCVYYNGIYNAKAAARAGDSRLRNGEEAEAGAEFALSAERAESVLARHPKSSWRPRALYLAGRGAALANQCDRAVPRLTEYLALGSGDTHERLQARLALGICDVRLSRFVEARTRLDSLIGQRDGDIGAQARRWAARAALATGDRDAVQRYVADLDVGSLQWELLAVSLGAGEFVRAESLLVQRAARGDYREDVTRALREMHSAGLVDVTERIVATYDASRVPDANRAAMHFALGDLYLRSGADSLARPHLTSARTLARRDSVTAREAAARLAMMGVPSLSSMRDLDSVLAREDSAVRQTAVVRRTVEQALLVRLLESRADPTGAALFLAAEVARDSLRAPRMATSLFLRVAREVTGSPLAANAFYAAALLQPDSAPEWHARIRTEHPNSAIAAWLRGEDPATRPDFLTAPGLLRFTWTETVRAWADSVRKLRLPPRPLIPANGTPRGSD